MAILSRRRPLLLRLIKVRWLRVSIWRLRLTVRWLRLNVRWLRLRLVTSSSSSGGRGSNCVLREWIRWVLPVVVLRWLPVGHCDVQTPEKQLVAVGSQVGRS